MDYNLVFSGLKKWKSNSGDAVVKIPGREYT